MPRKAKKKPYKATLSRTQKKQTLHATLSTQSTISTPSGKACKDKAKAKFQFRPRSQPSKWGPRDTACDLDSQDGSEDPNEVLNDSDENVQDSIASGEEYYSNGNQPFCNLLILGLFF